MSTSKKSVVTIIQEEGRRDCTVEVAIETHPESKSDLEALRSSLEKKSKSLSSRIALADEIVFERQCSRSSRWLFIGDDSPIKEGSTIRVVLKTSMPKFGLPASQGTFTLEISQGNQCPQIFG